MRGFGIGKPLTIVGARRRHSARLGGPVSALARHFERERRSHADTTAEILAERLSRMIEFPGEVDNGAALGVPRSYGEL